MQNQQNLYISNGIEVQRSPNLSVLIYLVTGNQKYNENGNGRAAKMGTRIQQNREHEYSDKLTRVLTRVTLQCNKKSLQWRHDKNDLSLCITRSIGSAMLSIFLYDE